MYRMIHNKRKARDKQGYENRINFMTAMLGHNKYWYKLKNLIKEVEREGGSR